MATSGQIELQNRIKKNKPNIDKASSSSGTQPPANNPTTPVAPVSTVATPPITANNNVAPIDTSTTSYNNLLKKGYTPQQIRDSYIKAGKIPKPVTPAEAPVVPGVDANTPKGKSQNLGGGNMEDVSTAPIAQPTVPTPVVETPATPTTPTVVPKAPKLTEDQKRYADDSEARAMEITNNLNTLSVSNPNNFKDLATFKNAFSYDQRSEKQKQLLDNWFGGYESGVKLNLSSDSDIINSYFNGSVTDNNLENLKMINPAKYDTVQAGIQKFKEFKAYGNLLKGSTDPVIDKVDTIISTDKKATDFYDEYEKAINSPEVTKLNTEVADAEKQIKTLQIDMEDIRRNTEKEFAGTGANTSTVEAIIADRQSDLQSKISKLGVDYSSKINKYNSIIGTAKDMLDAGVRKQEADFKERSAKLQELGFFYQYDPAGQAIQAEAKYNAENPDMDSKDPAKSRMALNQSLSQYFKDYGMIIQRSQSQVVGDVLKYAKTNNISVSQALKENFINPLQSKPEYQILKDKALGIEKEDNKPFAVGDLIFQKDANGNYVTINPTSNPSGPNGPSGNGTFTAEQLGRPAGSKNIGVDTNNFGNFVNGTGAGNIGTYNSPNGRNYSVFATAQDGYNALVNDLNAKKSGGSGKIKPNDTVADLLGVWVNGTKGSVKADSSYYKAVQSVVGNMNAPISSVDVNKLAEGIMKGEGTWASYKAGGKDLNHLKSVVNPNGGGGNLIDDKYNSLSTNAQRILDGDLTFDEAKAGGVDLVKIYNDAKNEIKTKGLYVVDSKMYKALNDAYGALNQLETDGAGFNQAVGGYGLLTSKNVFTGLPYEGSAGSTWYQKFQNAMAILVTPALQNMRGLGSMSDIEFKNIQDLASGGLSITMDEAGFKKKLKEMKEKISAGIEKTKARGISSTNPTLDNTYPTSNINYGISNNNNTYPTSNIRNTYTDLE